MRLSIIITFAIIYLVASASDDPTETYKCADALELDTCYLKQTATNKDITLYVKACKKGKTCYRDSSGGYCYKDIELLEEGDKCVLDEECKTQKCSQNKCAYLADGEECDGSNQCGIKSTCYEDKCVAYVGEGASCEEAPCRPGLVCGKIEDAEDVTCSKKFSVENGKKVSRKDLCKSGKIGVDGKCIDRTEDKSEWDAYVEEYIDEQENVLKEDKKKLSDFDFDSDYDTLNSKSVAEKYVEYWHKKEIGTGDDADCIKDYFIQQLSSYSLRFSFVSLLLLFVSLF